MSTQRDYVQMLAHIARRWMAQNYPELSSPPAYVSLDPASRNVPTTITGGKAIASSSARRRRISVYDQGLASGMGSIGRSGAYSGAYQRIPLQVMIHELLHQSGTPTGNTARDRFWEEGLAERVAADLAPGLAGSIYKPGKDVTFADGRRMSDYNFSFRPSAYPRQVQAVENVSYDHAAQALGGRGGILGNAILTPAAQAYRRELVPMSSEARRASITKTQRRKAAEVKQARSAKRQVATRAKDSSNSVAAAIQKVVAKTKYRKQPPAPGRPR